MKTMKFAFCSIIISVFASHSFAATEWGFAASSIETPQWSQFHGLTAPAVEPGKGLILTKTANDPYIGWTTDVPDAGEVGVVLISMRLSSKDSLESPEQTGQFYWATDMNGFCEQQSVKFPVIIDGTQRTYRIDLWSNPLWDRTVTGIRIDPVDNFFTNALDATIQSVILKPLTDKELSSIDNPVVLSWTSKASPNGDGICDEIVQAKIAKPAAYAITLDGDTELLSGTGSRVRFGWDGLLPNGAKVEEGTHTFTLQVGEPIMKEYSQDVYIEDREPWPQLPEKDWHRERPVGIWFDGRVEGFNVPPDCVNAPKDYDAYREYYRSCFTDIASKGIDIVVVPNTPDEGDYRDILLQEAEKADVQVVLEFLEFVDYIRNAPYDESAAEEMVREIADKYAGYRSLYAYQLIDEPPSELFSKMNLIARILAKYDPDRPCFSTLCNDGSVKAFSEMVHVPFVIFDRYTLGVEPRPDDWDWRHLRNAVKGVRDNSGEKPTWFVIQTFSKPGAFRFPTAEEVEREIDICIEEGCTVIFYFLYNSDTQQEYLKGFVDRDYKPMPLWEEFAPIVEYTKKRLAE